MRRQEQLQWIQVGLAALATASVVAVVLARRNAESDALQLDDPTEAISHGRGAVRLRVPAPAVSAYTARPVRTPTADELEAMVYAATSGTYQEVRDIRWARWRGERAQYDQGKLSLEDLWQRAAGHVGVALAFGGRWDRYGAEPSPGAVRSGDLVAFWFDYIARNYPAAGHASKVLDLAELLITRPTASEARWMMDYCKKLIDRLNEQAVLLGDAGSEPSLGNHPCDGNSAVATRFSSWVMRRAPTLQLLRKAPELGAALGFLQQLASEKTTLPQLGYPSEVHLDLADLAKLLGELVVLAMSGQALEMVSAARGYCAENSANPDGC